LVAHLLDSRKIAQFRVKEKVAHLRPNDDAFRDANVDPMPAIRRILFAIASALIRIASRSAGTTDELADDLTKRLTALGNARELVRPVFKRTRKSSIGGTYLLMLEVDQSGHAHPMRP